MVLERQQQAHVYEVEMFNIRQAISDRRQSLKYTPPFFTVNICVSVYTPEDVQTLKQLSEQYQVNIAAVIDQDFVIYGSEHGNALTDALRDSGLDVMVYCVPTNQQYLNGALGIMDALPGQCRGILRDTYLGAGMDGIACLVDKGCRVVLNDHGSASYRITDVGTIEWEYVYVSENYPVSGEWNNYILKKSPVALWLYSKEEYMNMAFVQSEIEDLMAQCTDDVVFGSVDSISAYVQQFCSDKSKMEQELALFIEKQNARMDEL